MVSTGHTGWRGDYIDACEEIGGLETRITELESLRKRNDETLVTEVGEKNQFRDLLIEARIWVTDCKGNADLIKRIDEAVGEEK